MASTSGSKAVGDSFDGVGRTISRKMTRMHTMVDAAEEPTADSELVPSSLAAIAPILRVANEIEQLNPRVAYLCRFHAFEKAHNLDPTSSGRGVRQFKTYLLHKLEKDEVETKPQLAKNDPKEIQKFYQWYYENYVKEGPTKRKPEEIAKHYQTASVLYDVLKTVVPSDKVDAEISRYAREVERKKVHFGHYNILPLHFSGAAPAIMELSEIKAAVTALCNVENLPMPRVHQAASARPNSDGSLISSDEDKPVHDLLDWLWLTFGFQKGNVENQREHLILLLANMDIRNKAEDRYALLDNYTVEQLLDKVFKNYSSWCHYLHCDSSLKFPNNAEKQQLQILYIGLYLLIWGEASNIRFMPECLCYIFHCMAKELHGIIFANVHSASGGYFEPAYQGEESFLRDVVTPIYQVLRKEVQRNKMGTSSHSKWRNYDDLNEYFWSRDCFKIGWPMDLKADFFIHTEEIHPKKEHHDQLSNGRVSSGRRKPKTNFVEVRTFWHLFRSFDRMWTFFTLAFQAMLIVAWSPSGSITAIFNPDVFRSVLSIFITAALLNFLQGTVLGSTRSFHIQETCPVVLFDFIFVLQ